MYEQSYKKAIVEADRIRARVVSGEQPTKTDVGGFFNRPSSGGFSEGLASSAPTPPTQNTVDPSEIALEYLSALRASEGIPNEEGGTRRPPITGEPGKALNALKTIESGNNYSALGPVMKTGSYKGDRAYGAYQVMGANIPIWTKQVLGYSMTPKEFLMDQSAQDKVALAKMTASYKRYGSWDDAASVWFSGGPLSKNANKSDGYNTVTQYVDKFRKAYGL